MLLLLASVRGDPLIPEHLNLATTCTFSLECFEISEPVNEVSNLTLDGLGAPSVANAILTKYSNISIEILLLDTQ